MTETSVFPELPPAPENPGEFLTHFQADMPKSSIDKDGQLVITLVVPIEDKYKAMPLTDIRGRRFNVSVFAKEGRRPMIREGVLAVYDGIERKQARAADRHWAQVKAEWFDGID